MTADVGEYGVYDGAEVHLHITGSIGARFLGGFTGSDISIETSW